ncbi:V-type proton ATPase subunit S1-like protein [Rhinatrema bivittatum]|uniref:V-type proton ATPase subunit S1-like protein n=1 Tax=Rhinatrema bivittatum TaxID=194408 RepID=UPI0011285775|nr:V-type proton ATPase subunit S1-like protein [Rhinatrema bivittatum]
MHFRQRNGRKRMNDIMIVERSQSSNPRRQQLQRLSLNLGDIGSLKRLALRFILTNSNYKLSIQNRFTLQCVQIIYNNSMQATFNASTIFAPAGYSYHCQRVSSLQQYDRLLMPSIENDMARFWEITFIDFQIQGFHVEGGQFSYAKDCAAYFSPAILMGLVMSFALLLVLAYALHMLIHLKSMDRHYKCKGPSSFFPKSRDTDLDEREPLRCNANECYELKHQQHCRIYMQQCSSVSGELCT